MPRAVKNKTTSRVTTTIKISKPPSAQCGIKTFGRISKSQSDRPIAGKVKEHRTSHDAVSPDHPCAVVEQPCTGKKRKAQDLDEDPDGDSGPEDRPAKRKVNYRIQEDSKTKSQHSSEGAWHPKTSRKKALHKSIPIETPTKGARSFLETFNLSSSPSSDSDSSRRSQPHSSTPPSSPPSSSVTEDFPQPHASDLPEDLQELIDLHASFLTALSLHYAHNGSLTPADFRLLRPNIERSWRKRRVLVKDIQTIFAISSSTASRLSLVDYGHSKICIEIDTPSDASTSYKRALNEEALNKTFIAQMLAQWSTYTTSHPSVSSVNDFIASLPLAPILPSTTTAALAPLLSKGQLRLQDLKAGAIKAQARTNNKTSTSLSNTPSNVESIPPTVELNNKPTVLLAARKSSLLDRILHKQASLAQQKALTPAQTQRLSALHRIEEIVPVLELLASSSSSKSLSGSSTTSFSMPMIIQHLQMSLRNPIEKDLAARAMRVLGEEVAPRWVSVREVGRLVAVVVRRGGLGVVGGREGVRRRVGELVGELS
ncbi:MAG: hypothetical protein Q9220_002156 [cf. Caloplaca sp. 1 TL-2023]